MTWKTSVNLTKISNKFQAIVKKSASQQISGGEPGQIIRGMYLSLPRKRKPNCDLKFLAFKDWICSPAWVNEELNSADPVAEG